jgi:hypothetical protein
MTDRLTVKIVVGTGMLSIPGRIRDFAKCLGLPWDVIDEVDNYNPGMERVAKIKCTKSDELPGYGHGWRITNEFRTGHPQRRVDVEAATGEILFGILGPYAAIPARVVAFGGQARAGKSTAADHLAAHAKSLGMRSARFSCSNAVVALAMRRRPDWAESAVRDKTTTEIRQFLTHLGETERMTNYLVWMRPLVEMARGMESGSVVFVDGIRYPADAAVVRALGGVLVKIGRPGIERINTQSETAMDRFPRWDAEIENGRGVEELNSAVERVFTRFCKGREA